METQVSPQEMKNQRQREAAKAWGAVKFRGTTACGTGWGKTKCAIVDCYRELVENFRQRGRPGLASNECLIVTTTEEMRDVTWPAEIATFRPNFTPRIICWASLPKTDLRGVRFLILDEFHHVTAAAMPTLKGYNGAVVGLTATPPMDEVKMEMFLEIAPICYTYGLEKGILEKLNSPYNLHIIKIAPDDNDRAFEAGKKGNKFKVTEMQQLSWLDKAIKKAIIVNKSWQHPYVRMLVSKRMQALYNSPTKRRAALHILKQIWSPDTRIVVFCGSIDQAETLLPAYSYHGENKKGIGKDRLTDFKSGKSNLIGAVKILDEGENLNGVDVGLVIQCDSSDRRLQQRLGRLVRYKDGHAATMYILCLTGTQDDEWVREGTQAMPDYRIKTFIYNNLGEFVADTSLKWR